MRSNSSGTAAATWPTCGSASIAATTWPPCSAACYAPCWPRPGGQSVASGLLRYIAPQARSPPMASAVDAAAGVDGRLPPWSRRRGGYGNLRRPSVQPSPGRCHQPPRTGAKQTRRKAPEQPCPTAPRSMRREVRRPNARAGTGLGFQAAVAASVRRPSPHAPGARASRAPPIRALEESE
jgi:hypothetical protein